MTTPRDPDAVLAAWLEEGPYRLPEETRRAIAFTTRTTEQKRRSSWAPWRTSQMPTFARIALAAVAVIALVGGAAYVIGPQPGVGGAPPTPSPADTSTPTASPSLPTPAPTSRLSGVLQIGNGPIPANVRVVTSAFTPAFTFIAPPGWVLDDEGPSHAWLSDSKGQFMIVRPLEMIAVGGDERRPFRPISWPGSARGRTSISPPRRPSRSAGSRGRSCRVPSGLASR